jgi:hypothetical protein|nr:MAG TPA: hypothetical protein [Ackermannviridae sp.]
MQLFVLLAVQIILCVSCMIVAMMWTLYDWTKGDWEDD